MLDNIANILQRECNLHTKNTLLIGISGGPDSLCLLHAVYSLGYKLIAAHVNHCLRVESDQEACLVGQFADKLGVEFLSCKVDVMAYAAGFSISIEEAARRLRYEYLFEQAKARGASAVLVAHNADDQVETILMHLLRGSGLVGLRGMNLKALPNPWSNHIPLVRPLLSTWRKDIERYLVENNLTPISDNSNLDTIFFRNRLRLELLPFLEGYNPRIRENLLRAGWIMREDYQLIEQLVNEKWKGIFVRQGQGYQVFNLSAFLDAPLAIQRYLLRKAISYHLPSLRDVDFDCIERSVSFLAESKPSGQTDLIAGLYLMKEGNFFWVASWQADLLDTNFPSCKAGSQQVLPIPGSIILNDGWRLEAHADDDPNLAIQESLANIDPFQAWLQVDGLTSPIIIRARKAGDRIKPLGMDGNSMKVSDVMINLKLLSKARKTWPLVCSGNEVLWIPGYRLSNLVRIQPGNKQVIHLILSRVKST